MKTTLNKQIAARIAIVAATCVAIMHPGATNAATARALSSTPADACASLIRIDPLLIDSTYTEPLFWSLSVNFKSFEKGNPARPYACLKVYGLDQKQGIYVDLSASGTGVPLRGCRVNGNVAMGTTTIGTLGTVFGVAQFSGNSGFVQCAVNLQSALNAAYQNGSISAMPDGSAPKLPRFQTLQSYLMAAAGSVQRATGNSFLSYQPGATCRQEAANLGLTDACNVLGYQLSAPYGLLQHETVADNGLTYTPHVEFDSIPATTDNCWLNPAAVAGPAIWWSVLGNELVRKSDQRHVIYEITNTRELVSCNAGAYQPIAIPFYTGASTLYIGGLPNTVADWGELYEVVIDPGSGSRGTDGVK